MFTTRRMFLILLLFSSAMTSLSAVAQVVTATVPTQDYPSGVAVNSANNKIYVTNYCGNDATCQSSGTVTVIDGVTNSTTMVSVGSHPLSVAVNPATNKIYVNNVCGDDPACATHNGTVTVIDGATLNTVEVPVGVSQGPNGLNAMAVNSVTNKIYVVNACGSDPTCQSNGTVTVIDGATNTTTTVTVGFEPFAAAVNTATNQIYVANTCGNDPTCKSNGTATVIDGATNNTTTVMVGSGPDAVAVNAITNQIYVANFQSNSVTVIDGATNNTTSVMVGLEPYALALNQLTNQIYVANSGPNNGTYSVTVIDATNNNNTTPVTVGALPLALAVDPVTNKIYVVNQNGNSVTMIDGATDSTVTVAVGSSPFGVAADLLTNNIYVANQISNNVSVIAGASAAALQFVQVTPCRLVDTRPLYGGSGPILGGTAQSFPVPQLGNCKIPTTAAAYSLNVTVVPSGPLGFLTVWPTGESQPYVSTLNSIDGRVKANAAIVPSGYQGAVSVFVTNTTNVVLDIDGYFAPVSDSTLAFYPLTPCRVADTRHKNGDLGGPSLAGMTERDFPVLESSCIPANANAVAYSFNFTAVAHEPLGFLTTWAAGQPQPYVSTLNSPTGTVVANAAIVPAGANGAIAVYPTNPMDLVIDINGYFAAQGQGGLSLYPMAPCRVLDTRLGSGLFQGTLVVNVDGSRCDVPSAAQAFVLNATVVPADILGFLTLWPDGENRPYVSTLNSLDGAVTSNMAIVPTNNGSIDAYATDLTQLVLDVSAYFAP